MQLLNEDIGANKGRETPENRSAGKLRNRGMWEWFPAGLLTSEIQQQKYGQMVTND